MRKSKIVCRIGGACESEEMVEKLIKVGMNVGRLNLSDGDDGEDKGRIDRIGEVCEKLGKRVGILLDSKGGEMGSENMKDGGIEVEKGREVMVSMREVEGRGEKL